MPLREHPSRPGRIVVRSVSVMEREPNATGFPVDSDFCSSTAPRPNADASAEVLVDLKDHIGQVS